jgi:hypothetical protein
MLRLDDLREAPATAANGNANPSWDFTGTWFMNDGHSYPLLASFKSPLTVSANGRSATPSTVLEVTGTGTRVTISTSP